MAKRQHRCSQEQAQDHLRTLQAQTHLRKPVQKLQSMEQNRHLWRMLEQDEHHRQNLWLQNLHRPELQLEYRISLLQELHRQG
jgi:hypothetical protein